MVNIWKFNDAMDSGTRPHSLQGARRKTSRSQWFPISATTEGSRLAKMIAILEEKEAKNAMATNQWILCATQEYRVSADSLA